MAYEQRHCDLHAVFFVCCLFVSVFEGNHISFSLSLSLSLSFFLSHIIPCVDKDREDYLEGLKRDESE